MSASVAFQFFVDRATNIAFNRRPIVATTVTRNGMTRAVSRGNHVWRFDITMPDGIRYSDIRSQLAEIDRYGQFTNIDIKFDRANYLFPYQGNLTNLSNIGTATIPLSIGNQVQLTNLVTDRKIVGRGDLIKINGRVYSVLEDAFTNPGQTSTTVFLHRTLIGVTAGAVYNNISVGPTVTFPLRAIQIPTFTLFGYDQVAWSGQFQLVERI